MKRTNDFILESGSPELRPRVLFPKAKTQLCTSSKSPWQRKISLGRSIYTIEIGKCSNQGLFPPGGPVVKHLPAYTAQRSLPILFGILRHGAGCTCPKGGVSGSKSYMGGVLRVGGEWPTLQSFLGRRVKSKSATRDILTVAYSAWEVLFLEEEGHTSPELPGSQETALRNRRMTLLLSQPKTHPLRQEGDIGR